MKQWFYMVLCVPMLFILNESSWAQSPVKIEKSTETVQKNQSANETSETNKDESKLAENSLAKSGKSVYILTNNAPNRSTSSVASWDFTTGADKYYGGATGAKELETGVWGMIGGDVNGSGHISAADRIQVRTAGGFGYLDEDVNLTGNVSAADRIFIRNAGGFSAVP
jgi:hypothetical protein